MRVIVVMAVIVLVGILMRECVGVGCAVRCCENVDLGAGDAAALNLACFQTRADAKRRSGLLQDFERYTGIDQGAEEHVAADAGKAVQIGNAHRCDSNVRHTILVARPLGAPPQQNLRRQQRVERARSEAGGVERDVLIANGAEGGGDGIKHLDR